MSTYYVKPWKSNMTGQKLWCLYEVLVPGTTGICVADSPNRTDMERYKYWIDSRAKKQ